MDPSLILHIGANKTGSSAIQRFLQKNVATFRSHGILIPDRELGWTNTVTGDHVFALQSFISGNRRELLPAFEAMIQAKPIPGKVLISAENLANPGNHSRFEEVCQKFDTKVIIYIRRQDDFITSSWQQWHSKIESDLNAWIITALRTLGHWERIIDAWETLVGAANVTVRLFERDQFPDGNVVWDFLNALGLGDSRNEFDGNIPEINPSFANYILPLVSGSSAIFKNVHDNDFYNLVQSLTGDIYTKDTRISLISCQQRDNILAFYASQNSRIREKWFPGRRTLFNPVDHSKYKYLDEKQLLDLQLRFITHLLIKTAQRRES